MILFFKCEKCGWKYDIPIKKDDPKTIECSNPHCEQKYYVLLNIFETSKGDKYYTTGV